MATIRTIEAGETTDSRGDPTIEVLIETEATKATATVPSGTNLGRHEAVELRDNDASVRGGRGIEKALANIRNVIAPALLGRVFDQRELDRVLCELDGTPNKRVLGTNAIFPVSIAFARADAREQELPLYWYLAHLARTPPRLPRLLFNVMNGGQHTRSGFDLQECMLAPTGFIAVSEQVAAATACMASLQLHLGREVEMSDEGGFAPSGVGNREALELLISSISEAGFTTDTVKIGIDAGATNLYREGQYALHENGEERMLPASELIEWYAELADIFPLLFVEDGLAEDDWDGFTTLTERLGNRLLIVGDDLTATNEKRIEEAGRRKAVNACIIKPNQIGTVTEAVDAVVAARKAGWTVFASHRSGETMDTFIADFAVGLACDYLKAGPPTREERMVKYNRLIEIERELHT